MTANCSPLPPNKNVNFVVNSRLAALSYHRLHFSVNKSSSGPVSTGFRWWLNQTHVHMSITKIIRFGTWGTCRKYSDPNQQSYTDSTGAEIALLIEQGWAIQQETPSLIILVWDKEGEYKNHTLIGKERKFVMFERADVPASPIV